MQLLCAAKVKSQCSVQHVGQIQRVRRTGAKLFNRQAAKVIRLVRRWMTDLRYHVKAFNSMLGGSTAFVKTSAECI